MRIPGSLLPLRVVMVTHPKKNYLDFEILKILSVYVGTKAEYVGELGIENL